MFAQLGSIIFKGLYAPESLSVTSETTYAEHALISGKPRLQASANNLSELSISLKLRAEFCNPTQVIKSLKTSKDTFEALPLITGSGNYMGNFVIISLAETHSQLLDDGTLIEATLQLSLKEFVVKDKLQQQQQTAKSNAFAVNKKPVNTGRSNQTTCNQTVSKHISAIKTYANTISNTMNDYLHAPSDEIANQYLVTYRVATRHIRTELQSLHDYNGSCIQNTDYKPLTEMAYNDAGKFAATMSPPIFSGEVVYANNQMQASLKVVYDELGKNVSNSITRQK